MVSKNNISGGDFESFLRGFEEYCTYEKRLSFSTVGWALRVTKRLYNTFGYISPSKEYARKVETTLVLEGKRKVTIARYLYIIERWYEYTSNGGTLRIKKPRAMSRVVEYLSEDEVKMIFEACKNHRDKAIIAILLYTGIRNKELCQLNIGDIDFTNHLLYIRDHGAGIKNHEESTVVMSQECVNLLRMYIDNERPKVRSKAVFVPYSLNKKQNQQYRRITPKGVLVLVKRLALAAGIERRVWVHLFRHTTGTQMAAKGSNIVHVKRQLRHRDIKSTLIYITADVELLRKNIDERFDFHLTGAATDP